MYTSPTLKNANIKSIIINTIITIQGRFTKSFKKGRWLKASKINKFIILRLSEAMKNAVKHC